MAGVQQLVNPGGAFGYPLTAQASRFYLFGEFVLDPAALRGCAYGTPVALGIPASGTNAGLNRNILPASETAAVGYNSQWNSVIGAVLEPGGISPSPAGANAVPADFAPPFSAPNAGIGNVLVGGYLTLAPVLGDATSNAAAATGVQYITGAQVAVSGTNTGEVVTSPSILSGCWYPFTIAPATATWAGIGNLGIAGPFPSNVIFAVGGTARTVTAASGAGAGAGFNTWTISGGGTIAAADVGSAFFVPTAGNAAGGLGLSTVITSIVTAGANGVFTTFNPNLKTGGSGSQTCNIGNSIDLWLPC